MPTPVVVPAPPGRHRRDEATRQATAAPPATGAGRPPALAEGVQLIGEYEGSGYKEAPSLVRRPDGQVIQLPPLLYSVAARADGQRGYDQIAKEVGAEVRRGIEGDQVRYLVEEKLRPLGILAAADGQSPDVAKADPFLSLKFRAAVISERTSNALGALFKPLFLPPVVLAALVTFVFADAWLFLNHGIAQALRQSIYHPGLFLPLFVGVVLSAAIHEIGHAAGCRYGGGAPGKMGCGLYMAWPAFYTDVTDAYRLGRGARLRTDLGGVYFNVVVVLATMGAYFVTRFEPLLLLVMVQHFEIAHQLLPIIRLDGYYIVADLTGVPDLFARIGPILRSMVPGRRADEQVTLLKRWVRVAVTAWVLIVVPLLVFELLIVLLHLPRIVATGWDSGVKQYHAVGHGFSSGHALSGVTAALELVVLTIPIVGIFLVLAKSARQGATWLWTHTEGRPVSRTLGVAAVGAALVLLLMAWVPTKNYRPIRPSERGTLTEGVAALRHLPDSGPLYSEKKALERGDQPVAKDPLAKDEKAPEPAPATTTTVARRGGGPATTVATRGTEPGRAATTTEPETTTTVARRSTTTTVP
jgi:putative peptide zinc metalloprotease protein